LSRATWRSSVSIRRWVPCWSTPAVVLVEASPVDRIWGVGLTRDDPAATDPDQWHGLNLLGFALMQVRKTLNDQHARVS
jgi:ribA/ribD-fused uncharacterized protein